MRTRGINRDFDIDWQPLPGPQTLAYESEADEVLYGGAAGGGKTDLQLGLALTKHQKTITFRREGSQTAEIEDRLDELLPFAKTHRVKKRWTLPDGRFIELGAVQHENDWKKYKGRPHDLITFDELTDFTRKQYRTLIIWNRTTDPNQKCKVMSGTNPPVIEEQMWVVDEWAPWLDPDFADPAQPGELRYYAYGERDAIHWFRAEDLDEDGRVEIEEELRLVKSRTFIPARIEDNPHLMGTDYEKQLDALPPELRKPFKFGDFTAARIADPLQVIPTQWVLLAQERWKKRKPEEPLTALGVDPSRGGKDDTVIAPRYGTYVDELISHQGEAVSNGPKVAALVHQHVKDECMVIFEISGSGASPYDSHEQIYEDTFAYDPARRDAEATDRSGKLHFKNFRAQWYWHLRELLDPVKGDDIALPPSPTLRQDLCTPRYKITAQGIQIEAKDEIKKRLGRSPDEGDATVISFFQPVQWVMA